MNNYDFLIKIPIFGWNIYLTYKKSSSGKKKKVIVRIS